MDKEKSSLTEELNRTFYEESQGILDIAVKLYALSQGRAIETGLETITPNLIRIVAKEDLIKLQPMLNALKHGREKELERFEDIMPMQISEYLKNRGSKIDLRATIEKKKEKIKEDKMNNESLILEKVISALMALNIDPKKCEKVAINVLKKVQSDSEIEIMSMVLEELKNNEKEKNKKTKYKINDLFSIIERGKKKRLSAYEVLKENGIISSPIDDFLITVV